MEEKVRRMHPLFKELMKNFPPSMLGKQEDFDIYNEVTIASRNVGVLGEIIRVIDYCPKDYPPLSTKPAGPVSLDNLRWELHFLEHIPQAINILKLQFPLLSKDIRVTSLGKFGGGRKISVSCPEYLNPAYILLIAIKIQKLYEGLILEAYDLAFDFLGVPLWGKCYLPGYTNHRGPTPWLISMTNNQDPPNRVKIYNKIATMLVSTSSCPPFFPGNRSHYIYAPVNTLLREKIMRVVGEGCTRLELTFRPTVKPPNLLKDNLQQIILDNFRCAEKILKYVLKEFIFYKLPVHIQFERLTQQFKNTIALIDHIHGSYTILWGVTSKDKMGDINS